VVLWDWKENYRFLAVEKRKHEMGLPIKSEELVEHEWKPLEILKEPHHKPSVIQIVSLERHPELHIWEEKLPIPSIYTKKYDNLCKKIIIIY